MVDVIGEHIEVIGSTSGPTPRIARHRIRVLDVVVWHEKLGMSPDEIVEAYPTITLADVHAALAYYWDHRDEIEHAIAEEHTFAAEFQKAHVGPLRQKLQSTRG